ncbi:hypothetical protein CCZ01_05975 [Helicobacter monodelphidis]|uniref:acyl-CoA dehydrogenase family protein n=1 Tax=Helicobacter sp. 15-1451 TaxID=2004995 RepID=UPI000DCDBE78|nr:acyl-CoA dehydrogenase family protein [Helicobacter sp. 15-1451]RAX57528.1 hypothetical protein CCZ01_05975 [Helicobacter sp. 15-1451]
MQTILNTLQSQRLEIDKGKYPKACLQELAQYGFYHHFSDARELLGVIEKIKIVSKVCGNTGFCVWCQNALLWYLFCAMTHNQFDKDKQDFLQNIAHKISQGEILGGTGLSNPMKSFAGFENNKLKAKKIQGGYLINGVLPWVSNIASNHYFAAIAKEDDEHFVMGLIQCDETLSLKDDTRFIALEGSATRSVCFKDYFLEKKFILSTNLSDFLPHVLPGFVAMQTGIALGLIEKSQSVIAKIKNVQNDFMLEDLPHLNSKKEKLECRISAILENPIVNHQDTFKEVLKVKLELGKLCLRFAELVMLCEGSKGYFKDSVAHKLLLESYFVAIVTPSLRHIKKLLSLDL